jgi:hypothetical protein
MIATRPKLTYKTGGGDSCRAHAQFKQKLKLNYKYVHQTLDIAVISDPKAAKQKKKSMQDLLYKEGEQVQNSTDVFNLKKILET